MRIKFNKEIVSSLEKQNCKSQSLHSKENNIISAEKDSEELGFVGSPTDINKSIIDKIIENKKVPVIAPLGLGEENQTYNINADTAAGSIAKKLKSRRLLLMTDIEGVIDNNGNLISEITPDLAKKMIDLSGLSVRDDTNPNGDIEIKYTGLRPGEKLYEELLIGGNTSKTDNPMIMRAQEDMLYWNELKAILDNLEEAAINCKPDKIRELLLQAVPEFKPQSDINDVLHEQD